jgi:hypothetical protein
MRVKGSKKCKSEKGIDRIFEGHEVVRRKKIMDENIEKDRKTRGHVYYRKN